MKQVMPCHWRLLAATLLLLAASVPTAVRAHTDADGYETFTRAGASTPLNAYKLHTTRALWDVANALCMREGAHLMVIDAVDEVRLVRTLFDHVPLPGPNLLDQLYVGFLDKGHDGAWKTVLGADLSTTGNHVAWAPKQPDNAGAVEHCGAVTRDILYNDVPCDRTHQGPFICEKELASREVKESIEELIESIDERQMGNKAQEDKSRFLTILFKL